MRESEYKMNLVKIGLRIAYYRKLAGMTQEQLAEAVDAEMSAHQVEDGLRRVGLAEQQGIEHVKGNDFRLIDQGSEILFCLFGHGYGFTLHSCCSTTMPSAM